jgi:hypothetical protein
LPPSSEFRNSTPQTTGSPLELASGVSLQAHLVLTAPPPSPNLGRAVYLSARTIDSYLLTCQYSTAPLTLPPFGSTVCSFRARRIHHTCFFPLFDRSALATREGQRFDRPTGPREKYNRSGPRPSHSLDGLRHSYPTTSHASPPRSHPRAYRTLELLPRGTTRHSDIMLSGRHAIPASFTPS